jgi:hypothetical protein
VSFVHATSSRVLVNQFAASGYITGYSCQHTRKNGETTVLTDSGERSIPGLLSGKLTVKGLFDSTAGSLHAVVDAAITAGTDNPLTFTVAPDATTLGQPCFITVCDPEDYSVSSSVKEATSIQVDAAAEQGVDWGVILHDHVAVTTDANGTGVDNAAATTNGGTAVIHSTAFSGLTNDVVKIQHSTDNSVWADLVTFTTVTAVGYELVRVAAGTTVNRYLRATWDVTGTGSHTFLCAFARR